MGIVLGAEGYGLRKLVRQNCDQLVKIQGNGPLKDLNVSNAAAVAMYEIKKGVLWQIFKNLMIRIQ